MNKALKTTTGKLDCVEFRFRPKENKKDYFSHKLKGKPSLKVLFICDFPGRWNFMSNAYKSKVADSTVLDAEFPSLSKEVPDDVFLSDKIFQDKYIKTNPIIIQGKKKPKNGELTVE